MKRFLTIAMVLLITLGMAACETEKSLEKGIEKLEPQDKAAKAIDKDNKRQTDDSDDVVEVDKDDGIEVEVDGEHTQTVEGSGPNLPERVAIHEDENGNMTVTDDEYFIYTVLTKEPSTVVEVPMLKGDIVIAETNHRQQKNSGVTMSAYLLDGTTANDLLSKYVEDDVQGGPEYAVYSRGDTIYCCYVEEDAFVLLEAEAGLNHDEAIFSAVKTLFGIIG